VFAAFDAREGETGSSERARAAARRSTATAPRDLAALPPNDLASSPLADELRELGAFRADVTGAGPTVYGLFLHGEQRARRERECPPRAHLAHGTSVVPLIRGHNAADDRGGSTRGGRWLRQRRLRIALWVR
jgi:hypothetical protein